MFDTGIGAFAGGAATASLGGSQAAAPASAMAPGASMESGGGSSSLWPTHPAGVAFWIGVGSLGLLVLLYFSLPQ